MTSTQRQAAAVWHAERAHALLAEAEASWISSGSASVSDRMEHRVAMAHAHGTCALAISALVIPNIAPLQQ
jgi:hypothetical protein